MPLNPPGYTLNKPEDPSFAEDVGAGIMEPMDTAFTTLGKDFDTAMYGQEKGASGFAKHALAGAKLPLDVAGAAVSVGEGLEQGALTLPAAGLHALQTDKPEGSVPAYTDEHGKHHPATVLTPEQLAAYRSQETLPTSQQEFSKKAASGPGLLSKAARRRSRTA